jgi:hypothetical protein
MKLLKFVIGKERRERTPSKQADRERRFLCSKTEMGYSHPLLWGYEIVLVLLENRLFSKNVKDI